MPNGNPPSANRSVSSTKESPAIVKEIPKQSSKDIKANSKKPESRERAKIPASQLKPGRSKIVMLRKGERTTEGRPSPREIKNASAGIKAARQRVENRLIANRLARGMSAKESDPIIDKLRIRPTPNMTNRQKDILVRSNLRAKFKDKRDQK
ncbi:MAG TPA: hypothetical protein V6C58_02530 [Allocoleopsis sp.]